LTEESQYIDLFAVDQNRRTFRFKVGD
jgi:hypothetical protein